jgi:hypothetical protein
MTEKDIEFMLSGGQHNSDPLLSIGGEPSRSPVKKIFNNLFDDVTREQTIDGSIDYRCIYVKLLSSIEKLKNASVFLTKEADKGADIELGFAFTNDVQAITIPGSPVGGSFRLAYTESSAQGTKTTQTRDILWVPDTAFMSQRIAALINSLGNLTGVTCLGQRTSDSYDFIITFSGTAKGRAQELLRVVDDQGLNVRITRIGYGGPINSTAPNIGISNNPPTGVVFDTNARREPLEIGTMLPGDILPIWIKREVSQGTLPVHPDKFGVKIMGLPVAINTTSGLRD